VERQATELEQLRSENKTLSDRLAQIDKRQNEMIEWFKKNAVVLGTVEVPKKRSKK
jgi:hypothetical protein